MKMILNPAKREDRVIMLRAGFTEKELVNLYNRLVGNIILEVDWDEA